MGERTNALNESEIETASVEDTIEMPRSIITAPMSSTVVDAPPLAAVPAVEPDDVDALRTNIEQTRSEMTQTIDAIKEKLSPQHLVEEAKESVREAATERVEKAKEAVHETAFVALATAKEFGGRAKETAAEALGTAKEVVGGAVGTLKEKAVDAKEKVTETVAGAKESASSAALSAKDAVGDVLGGAGERAKSAGTAAVSTVRDHPTPFVLVGAGLGVAAGVYLLTRRRNEESVTFLADSATTQVSPVYPIEPPLTPAEEAAAERVAAQEAAAMDEDGSGLDARATVTAVVVLVSGLAAYWVLRETRR